MLIAAKILYLIAIPLGAIGISGLVLVAIANLPIGDTARMASFVTFEIFLLGGFGFFANLVLRL